MRRFLLASCLAAAAALTSLPASATVVFTTGNVQYTNVNIAADTTAASITGEIGITGATMTFNTMIGPDGSTQVDMHGQHGVAFVESAYDSTNTPHTGFASLTMTAQGLTAWTAGDFALDQLNSLTSPTGLVTFFAYDKNNNLLGSNTLAISQTGQNQYNFSGAPGDLVTRIVITVATTDLLQDIKQVSLNAVNADGTPLPEPSTLALLGATAALFGVMRRRHKAA